MPEEQTPEVTQVTGGAGTTETLGWKTEIPESLRSHEVFASYKGDSKDELWKGHIEAVNKAKDLEGRLGNTIPKLPENATDEQKTTYYTALGRPEKPAEYEFAQVPDGIPIDEKLIEAAKAAFYANGLNKEQAKGVSGWWNTYMGQLIKAEVELRAKERNDAEVALKAELGDKYDANIELAGRVWKKFSTDDFSKFVNETKIGNDPRLIKFMINLAKVTGEDVSPSGRPAGAPVRKAGQIVYDKTPPVNRGY
jgi:hypothetical protein